MPFHIVGLSCFCFFLIVNNFRYKENVLPNEKPLFPFAFNIFILKPIVQCYVPQIVTFITAVPQAVVTSQSMFTLAHKAHSRPIFVWCRGVSIWADLWGGVSVHGIIYDLYYVTETLTCQCLWPMSVSLASPETLTCQHSWGLAQIRT